MKDKTWVQKLLERTDAIKMKHVELQSGYHSDVYVHARKPLADRKNGSRYSAEAGTRIASRFSDEEINIVINVTSGGDLLGEPVARFLSAKWISFHIERGKVELPKEVEIIGKDSRILIVDDVLRAPDGRQMKDALNLIKEKTEGNVKGIAVMVDRTSQKVDLDVRVESLVKYTGLRVWPREKCELCKMKNSSKTFGAISRQGIHQRTA